MFKKIFLVLMFLIIHSSFSHAKDVNGVVLDEPSPIENFKLKDQNGKLFNVNSLKGQWSLVFLGFTHCPDVCPFTLSNLDAVRGELAHRLSPTKLPKIVFLAVDPERDSPLLADYVKNFGLDFTGITGERKEIDSLVNSLDGYYRLEKKSKKDNSYNVVHSAAIAVINPNGDIVAKVSPPMKPFQTANYLYGLMRDFQTN